MSILTILCYILFVLAAIVLIVVVLLQEGRGGGFGEALGVHGRETFGVGSKGINSFTGWTAGVFLVAALAIHWLNREHIAQSGLFGKEGAGQTQVVPGEAESAPAPAQSPAESPAPTDGQK
jgi:preprotein translocase subunit SecG